MKAFKYYPTKKKRSHSCWPIYNKNMMLWRAKKNSLWTNDLSSIGSLCLSDDPMHTLARFVFSLLKIQWYLTYNGNVYCIKTKFMGTSHRCFFKNLYRISNVHTTKSSKTCDCIYKYGIYINPYIFFF